MTLKKLLSEVLDEKEMQFVPTSFDIVGNKEKAVAIIEIPPELESRKREIANTLMKKHKNVESVLAKRAPRSGIFRLHDYELLAGDKDTTVIHTESGCRFILDPQKTYFSTRESTERMRIAEQVKDKEVVAVFFAGIGPFAVVIAKKANPSLVIGIEINPDATKYFRKNVRLNKLTNVEVVEGDVKIQAPKYYQVADRIVMPLPETAHEFLEEAMNTLKPGGTCHMYTFASTKELIEKKQIIQKTADHMSIKVEVGDAHKVLQWGPDIWKYRIDFKKL
ncbi:SAM-dependent methyltransferase [archaeon]|nr:SAM-dependent methyltransferase [archaeon]|tara:strand:- start:908 stop:1741 length:834 start_codon:yes stop_codon:yes gene_type:complete